MIGAIIGDIVGSRFEFRNHLSKEFELFTDECEFTDDTVMTCAVADALLRCGDRNDDAALSRQAVESMQRIGRMYPDCGYGARFIHWMFSDDPQPYNSCGNGSAMRVSAVGFLAQSEDEVKRLSRAVNYHADAMGTQTVFESVGEVFSAVRARRAVDAGWRDRAEADYNARNKGDK